MFLLWNISWWLVILQGFPTVSVVWSWRKGDSEGLSGIHWATRLKIYLIIIFIFSAYLKLQLSVVLIRLSNWLNRGPYSLLFIFLFWPFSLYPVEWVNSGLTSHQQRDHMETGPLFKVSSKRPVKRGIELAIQANLRFLDWWSSVLSITPSLVEQKHLMLKMFKSLV